MLLGKRQRPPIRRTTSMSEFVADLEPSDQGGINGGLTARRPDTVPSLGSMAYRRPPGRNSGDLTAVVTAPFLRSCGLCHRRLAPGRDIFMYRGEIAFCSLECRQQQMNHDEKKEKCYISSIKDSTPVTPGPSDPSGTAGTIAAA